MPASIPHAICGGMDKIIQACLVLCGLALACIVSAGRECMSSMHTAIVAHSSYVPSLSSEIADFYWHEPGSSAKQPIETFLLVGEPHPNSNAYEPVDLHIMTGRVLPVNTINVPDSQQQQSLLVYRPKSAPKASGKKKKATDEQQERCELEILSSMPETPQ